MSKRWPDKVIVGLTGNIATGKSTVMAMAGERGALALDADKVVHEILAHDRAIQEEIVSVFGEGVQESDGAINRKALGDIVFADPAALRQLEGIVHPAVRQRLFNHIKGSRTVVVFIEAIKLLEGDLAAECDQIWVTRCSKEIRIARLVNERGMDEKTAAARVNAQGPQEEKVAKADVVIDTDGTLDQTRIYFELAWSRLMQNRDRSSAAAVVSQQPVARKKSWRMPSSSSALGSSTPSKIDFQSGEIIVRRAKPSDVPSLLLLMQQATGGAIDLKRSELLKRLGDRGYLIGQHGTTISAIAGWYSDSQVARIEEIFVHPPEAAVTTGVALLQEIEHTANQLICEVILAFPTTDGPEQLKNLFIDHGFESVDPALLPDAWQAAVDESRPDSSLVMVKRLQ